MATVEEIALVGENRIVLSGISWEVYEQLRVNEENRHVHMAYDEGTLELMSPSPDHEAVSRLLGQMIEALTEELGIPRRSLKRGGCAWPTMNFYRTDFRHLRAAIQVPGARLAASWRAAPAEDFNR